MLKRVNKVVHWLKQFWPVLRAIELGEMAWGFWERIPGVAKHLLGYGLSWVFFSFGWTLVSSLANYGTRNWPTVLLVGFALATIMWAIIEALRFRVMQGTDADDKSGTPGVELDEPPSHKVPSPGRRVSVVEDIDGKYLRLKVTNVGRKEEEFEVKFDSFHGTGEEESAYNPRWRGTTGRGRRLKADDFDYINVAECLGPTGTGTSKLRFFTADLPAGEGISHYFEREIPLGYSMSWEFKVHAEPPLATPLAKSCMIHIGKDGWVKAFTIDPDFGGFTGPPMQLS